MSRPLSYALLIGVTVSVTACRKADEASPNGNVETARIKHKALPESGIQYFPARTITKENINEFWADLKQKQEAGKGDVEHVKGRKTVAFVTNGIASFWNVAAAGAKVAAREAEVNLEIKMPAAPELANQKRILEDLSSREDITGIAVSPIKPEDQRDLLNKLGDKKHYLTQDSDAPQTNRLAYIGMSNYDAGRDCGKLVKAAMPEGGTIMIFVGRLDQDNAKLRRQGVIDELLDRSHDASRYDKNEKITGDKYTILGTMTDDFDFAKAKQNAEDAISKHPELNCMVGLFAYNPPNCLQAIRAVGREVKPGNSDSSKAIKLVAFDEADDTLQAIVDGEVYGTVVQNPYMYGHDSVRILAALAKDEGGTAEAKTDSK